MKNYDAQAATQSLKGDKRNAFMDYLASDKCAAASHP
jgi:hypothetical protein